MGIISWSKSKLSSAKDKTKQIYSNSRTKRIVDFGVGSTKTATKYTVEKGKSAIDIGKDLQESGKKVYERGAKVSSIFNKITGHKDSPGKLFWWTLYIMITITISAATNGYPLRLFANMSAWIMAIVIGGLNFIFTLTGGDLLDDFIIYSYQIFLTGYLGIMLNVMWAVSVLRKTSGIFSIFTNMLKWSFYWIWILMALNIIYTGNLFGIAQSPISLCGLHQNININTGWGDPVACDPIELEALLTESVDRTNNNALISGIFSGFETRDGNGVYFKSDDVERYDINENAGASINNIDYSKAYYTSYPTSDLGIVAEDIVIIGEISADKLILDSDTQITVELSPKLDSRSCTGVSEIVYDEFNAQFSGKKYSVYPDLDSIDISQWCNQDWSCNIENAEKLDSGINIFNLSNNQNTRFTCRRDGLAIDLDKITLSNGKSKYPSGFPISTIIDFKYTTEAIATKQIFVMDKEIVTNEADPLAYFNIDKTLTNSKSITDKKIDFGIGTLFNLDYIQPNYNDNAFPLQNSLAISITNPSSSLGNVRDMSIELRIYPGSENLEFVCNPISYSEDSNGLYSFKNPCTSGQLTGSFIYQGTESTPERDNAIYHVFKSSTELDVLSGDTYTADINSIIRSDILEGSDYQGLFIESIIDYKYELSEQLRGSIRESQ